MSIDDAAGWTWEFFEENDVAISEAVANKPTPYIAEVRARHSAAARVLLSPPNRGELTRSGDATFAHRLAGRPPR